MLEKSLLTFIGSSFILLILSKWKVLEWKPISTSFQDILFFILTELNDIAITKIDLDNFDSLQTKRTQRLGWYLNKNTKTNDFIRILQNSALFHFIPKLNGSFMVRYYDRDVASDALHHYDFNYILMFIINKETKKWILKN